MPAQADIHLSSAKSGLLPIITEGKSRFRLTSPRFLPYKPPIPKNATSANVPGSVAAHGGKLLGQHEKME